MSFAENLRGLGPGRQMTLVAGGVALLAGVLVAAYLTWFHTPYRVLFANLRPVDAAAVVADLDKKKTPYRLQDDGTTILVPEKIVDATRLSVASTDLPLKGVVGFELFNKSDMGLTEFAQRINYRRALEGELARTIMSIDAVDSARVHLALAEPTIFKDDRRPSRASVSLIPRPGKTLSAETVLGVQRLVAAAATDLETADVVVLDQHGQVVSGSAFPDAPASPASVNEQAAVEQYYAARIRQALQTLYPDDRLQVKVAAEPPRGYPGTPLSADPFAAWTPGTRTFALHATVRLAAAVGPEVRDEIQATAAQALGLTPASGDTVSVGFEIAPATADSTTLSAAAPPAAALAKPPLDLTAPRIAVPALSAVVLLLLLGVAAWLHRRGAGPRRLNLEERRRFAARLGLLLAEEEPRAADTV